MNTLTFRRLLFCATLVLLTVAALSISSNAIAAQQDIPPGALSFIKAYPQAALHFEADASGQYLVSGKTRIPYANADGSCPRALPSDAHDAPVCATLAQHYPQGSGHRSPAPGFDPGRVRSEAALKFLYGGGPEETRANCVEVPFFGEQLLVNSRHGLAEAFHRVAMRLETLAAGDPALMQYLTPSGGAYFWRQIQDSPKLSGHSFGTAVDLNVAKGPYWLWNKTDDPVVVDIRKNYPQIIVDAFEEEGFVWGGKWHAFDFMHYEFRPELLPKTAARFLPPSGPATTPAAEPAAKPAPAQPATPPEQTAGPLAAPQTAQTTAEPEQPSEQASEQAQTHMPQHAPATATQPGSAAQPQQNGAATQPHAPEIPLPKDTGMLPAAPHKHTQQSTEPQQATTLPQATESTPPAKTTNPAADSASAPISAPVSDQAPETAP